MWVCRILTLVEFLTSNKWLTLSKNLLKNGDECDIESEDEKCKPYFFAEERIKYMQVIEDIEALIFNEDDHGLFYQHFQ